MADHLLAGADQVKQLFDDKAAAWSSKYAPNGRLTGRLTRLTHALNHLVPAGARVLDLGCATGNLALTAADDGLLVTACDISEEMLRRASAADVHGLVDWVKLAPDWQILPFEGQSFNVVLASSVLEYVNEPAVILREAARVLRPGGSLLCTVPNLAHPVRWLELTAILAARLARISSSGRRWSRLRSYLTYLEVSRHRRTERWWNAVAEQAGLRPVKYAEEAKDHSPLRLLTFRSLGNAEEG